MNGIFGRDNQVHLLIADNYWSSSAEESVPLYYLPPGSPEGDYNLHHVRVYVRACVGACVRVSRSFL